MEISKYLKINRIEFMTTYMCTGRCRHCSVGDSLCRKIGENSVRRDESAAAVRKIAEAFDVKSIMTFGGEPLLYPETVCAIHAAGRDAGIGRRQVITNGYFSKDPRRIRQVAENLAENGVNEVLLSVDAFHQERIPLKYVMEFARGLKSAGIGRLKLSPAWVVNRSHKNAYNARTEEILAEFAPLDIEIGDGNDIFMAGNAAKYLAEFYPPPVVDMSQKCGEMPYTAPPTEVTCVSIEPNGDVIACSIPIGNIYDEDVSEIISRYNPMKDERICALMEKGAAGLIEAARKNGQEVDISGCYSVCDVCRKVFHG